MRFEKKLPFNPNLYRVFRIKLFGFVGLGEELKIFRLRKRTAFTTKEDILELTDELIKKVDEKRLNAIVFSILSLIEKKNVTSSIITIVFPVIFFFYLLFLLPALFSA